MIKGKIPDSLIDLSECVYCSGRANGRTDNKPTTNAAIKKSCAPIILCAAAMRLAMTLCSEIPTVLNTVKIPNAALNKVSASGSSTFPVITMNANVKTNIGISRMM